MTSTARSAIGSKNHGTRDGNNSVCAESNSAGLFPKSSIAEYGTRFSLRISIHPPLEHAHQPRTVRGTASTLYADFAILARLESVAPPRISV